VRSYTHCEAIVVAPYEVRNPVCRGNDPGHGIRVIACESCRVDARRDPGFELRRLCRNEDQSLYCGPSLHIKDSLHRLFSLRQASKPPDSFGRIRDNAAGTNNSSCAPYGYQRWHGSAVRVFFLCVRLFLRGFFLRLLLF
jgi:hypothetical protein